MPVAAIAGVGSLIAGGIGAIQNASAQDRAAMLQNKAVQQWLDVNIPNPNEQKVALQRFVQQGELHPAIEQGLKQAQTELSKITPDAGLRDTRLRALSALEQQGYGGEQVQDAAARQKGLIEAGAANRGHQQAIVSDLARRGQLGSGLELSSRLQTAQGDADRNASNALDIEGQRRNRMLQSIEAAGGLAGDIQNQDYSMASNRAKAQDAINAFNTQNLIGTNQRNIDRSNAAQKYNLGLKQDIADQNTNVANQEQQYNKNVLQQNFQNQATKAAGMAGQFGQQANLAAQQGANNAALWGGIASASGTIGQGVQNQNNTDRQFEATQANNTANRNLLGKYLAKNTSPDDDWDI